MKIINMGNIEEEIIDEVFDITSNINGYEALLMDYLSEVNALPELKFILADIVCQCEQGRGLK